MASRSSDSSEKPVTRRRRTVRPVQDDAATAPPEEVRPRTSRTASNEDDASDVIFEEGEGAAAGGTIRRRKVASRRRISIAPETSEPEPASPPPAAAESDETPRPARRSVRERRPRIERAESDAGMTEAAPAPDFQDEAAPPRPRRRSRYAEAGDSEPASVPPVHEEREPHREDAVALERPSEEEGREPARSGDFRDFDGRPRRRRRRRRRPGGDFPEGREQRDPRESQNFQSGGGYRDSRPPRGGRGRRGGGDRMERPPRRPPQHQSRYVSSTPVEVVEGTYEGVLEIHPKGYGFMRDPKKNYVAQDADPFVPGALMEKYRLREGVLLKGHVAAGIRNQGPRLMEVESIDGLAPEDYAKIKPFEDQTPITPYRQIKLETGPYPLTMRVMDLLTPVGKGQRALIVAPPRTGKTMLLQDIADAVSINHPEMHLIVLLIDERPEEVTEMRRKVKGEVIASSLDNDVESHIRLSQFIIERAKRMTEVGKDVFVLMDSITRMARAFNKSSSGSRMDSRTGTGGLSVKALDIPKKLFGTARQFEEGGSLTIVATALIDTGTKMDEIIFQEFKGTGNMELVLSRDLADRRIWPAIDITRSGTRHEEKLLGREILDSVTQMRRSLISLSPVEAMETLTRTLEKFQSNREFLVRVKAML